MRIQDSGFGIQDADGIGRTAGLTPFPDRDATNSSLPLQGEGRDGDGGVALPHAFTPIPTLTPPLKGRELSAFLPKNGITHPCIPHPASSKGFSLIELIVAITVVVVLAGVLLNRLQYYQEQAEKTAMQQVAAVLQSALTLQYGRLLTSSTESGAAALAIENPMNWLAKIPDNYSGEFYDVTPRSVAPGNWVFDLKSRNLIYVVDRGDHFTPGKDGHKWVRYHVNLLYETAPGTPVKKTKELVGILFEPMEYYRWFD